MRTPDLAVMNPPVFGRVTMESAISRVIQDLHRKATTPVTSPASSPGVVAEITKAYKVEPLTPVDCLKFSRGIPVVVMRYDATILQNSEQTPFFSDQLGWSYTDRRQFILIRMVTQLIRVGTNSIDPDQFTMSRDVLSDIPIVARVLRIMVGQIGNYIPSYTGGFTFSRGESSIPEFTVFNGDSRLEIPRKWTYTPNER